jgi:uncharacterized RDD family membrane protein YckC
MMPAVSTPYPDSPHPDWRFDAVLTEGVLSRRIAAWFVDFVILAVLATIAWLMLLVFGILTLGLGLHLMVLLPALPLVYTIGFIASPLAATPGQAACGLILARNDDLGPPGLPEAIVFALGFYLTMAVGFVLLIVALFTTRKRALHDLAAGLVVVRRRALTAAPPPWNMSRVA